MFLRTRFVQRSVVAAGALALAVGMTACGSDDDTSDATGATSVAVTTSVATTTPTSSAAAPPAPVAAPDPVALQGTLTLIVDQASPVGEKTAVLVNGNEQSANLEKLTQALADYGVISFVVGDIVVTGQTATSTVQITSPHGTASSPMTWEQIDGYWKLTEASFCQLLTMGGVPCA